MRWAGGWERARDRDRHSTKTKVPSELGVSAAALDGEYGSAWRRRQCRSARREGGVLHAFVLWSRDLFTGSSCCTGRGQTKSKKCNQPDSNVKKRTFHKEATDQGTNDGPTMFFNSKIEKTGSYTHFLLVSIFRIFLFSVGINCVKPETRFTHACHALPALRTSHCLYLKESVWCVAQPQHKTEDGRWETDGHARLIAAFRFRF